MFTLTRFVYVFQVNARRACHRDGHVTALPRNVKPVFGQKGGVERGGGGVGGVERREGDKRTVEAQITNEYSDRNIRLEL
jgi:hypothetical protein